MAKQGEMFALISDDQKAEAEKQIIERQKETDFDIREYPIEVIVSKYIDKLEETDKAELFCSGQLIPDTVLSFSSVFAGANPSLN